MIQAKGSSESNLRVKTAEDLGAIRCDPTLIRHTFQTTKIPTTTGHKETKIRY